MTKTRKGALVTALAGMTGMFAVFLPTGAAVAHGAYTFPPSRTYACYQNAHQDNGALDPSNPACAEVLAREGNYPFYNWFSNLISDAGDTQAGEQHFHSSIPDGQLCGPTEQFSAYNMARTDWPTTEIPSGATVDFRWQAWAAHPGWFYQYVTKPGWNPNEPLSWGDLELFNTADHPPLNGGAPNGQYEWSAQVPGRSGQHIIYTIWERSDSREVFFSCSDVYFTGGGGGGGEPDAQAPTAPGAPTVSGVSGTTATLSWPASSDNVGVTGYDVYQDGALVASTSNTSVTVEGLAPQTDYDFRVVARDAAGNTSPSSPTVTVTTGTAPPEGQCRVDYVVPNEWQNGFTGNVTITNTGDSAIQGWTLEWDFPGGQTVTSGWSAEWTQSGNHVVVRPAGWNGTISPGGSVTVGFNGSGSGSGSVPDVFLLNGGSCATA